MYFDRRRRRRRRFPVHSILMTVDRVNKMFDGLSPSYTKVINCFCISLESSKGKHALIILYDKCKLWPLRRR